VHLVPDLKVDAGDLNGDGRVDVVVSPAEKAGGESQIAWFEAPADPRGSAWTERVIAAPVETVYHSLAAGDLDGDGAIDIATAEMHQGVDPDEVALHQNLGGGVSWRKQVLSARGSHDIVLADIGGDGDLDIIGANWSSAFQPVELWENGSRVARGPSGFAGARPGEEREVAGIKLCWCPPGRFLMGSPRGEPERRPGEDQVEVTLTKGFWIGKHEVTQGEWRRVAGDLPGKLTAGAGDDFPVYAVNFAEAEEFCQRLTEAARASGELPGEWEIRLPTEAQWEFACRAGTTTATSFGDRLSSKQANFQGKPYNGAEDGPSLQRSARVGSYPANPWGIHDLHGNVFEWCRDWYHAALPGGADPDLHAAMATATRSEHGGISRVRRGGSWADEGWPCRSAFRLRFEPERRHDHIGFRIAVVRP
jgi:formylglycine-generating enzyme required for sulfatase activity